MPRTVVVEEYHEFVERQGGTPLDTKDHKIRFPSGAWVSGHDSNSRCEPPEDRDQLLHNLYVYRKEWARRKANEFYRDRQAIYKNPYEGGIEHLERMLAVAQKAKDDLEVVSKEIQERFDASDAGQRDRSRIEHENQVANAQYYLRPRVQMLDLR